MHLTAWTTLAVLVLFIWLSVNVGRARKKYNVAAPSTDGPLEFQSIMRVQLNTVEQLLLFFPALWMCAYFYSDRFAAAGGIVWIVGRIIYALSYYKDPAKRGPGFGLTILASVGLMIGTILGLIA